MDFERLDKIKTSIEALNPNASEELNIKISALKQTRQLKDDTPNK